MAGRVLSAIAAAAAAVAESDDALSALRSSADGFGFGWKPVESDDSAAFCWAAISSAVRNRPPGPRGRRMACL